MSTLHPVWPKVSQKILSLHSSSTRNKIPGNWFKLVNSKNVETILEKRNKKAETRHDRGLCLEDAGGLTEAANKLADAVFFLYKAGENPSKENKLEVARKLTLIKDLNKIIDVFANEQS